MATYIVDTFPDHVSGDTFPGRAFAITVNSVAPSLVGATINMIVGNIDFKKIYSNTTGEIEVTDVGKFQLKEQVITLPKKRHDYEIVITFASGKVKTWIKGTWLITE
jgi:hypothetical protein